MLVEYRRLREDLLAVNSDATALCQGLPENQLAARPDPNKWSIAENLVHLRITTELYLPVVDQAIARTRTRQLNSNGPFRLGWYGRLLVRYVEPPPLIRLPAPKKLVPVLPGAASQALPDFLESQAAMLQRIESAGGLNLTGFRFPSPLASYVRMNLMEFFSVFNGHSRRHLWQARNVLQLLGAPR